MLRETREERGLDLLTIHDRIGRPITQLEDLENGDLDALPDQAGALSTLRRYAAFLTLDGDALALQLMEAWSTAADQPKRPSRELVTATGVITTMTSGPDHLRAFTQTGPVPVVGGGGNSGLGSSGAYGYGVATGPPTGMLMSVVPRDEIKETKRASARERRRHRAPTSLKVFTWLVLVLTVAAVAGLIIQRQRPQWMVDAHLLHITQPDGQPVATTATTVPPTHHVTAPTSAVVAGPTDNTTQATYSVNAQQFTLGIITSGPCWVQVTSPASITPLLEGVQNGGTVQSFKANKSITLQVGSSAVVVSIEIKGKTVFLNKPKSTPFTYTFASKP
jgi:hypothetical protein